MYESGKKTFGKSFEIFLRIKEVKRDSIQSARYLSEEFENAKALSFFLDILQQLRTSVRLTIKLFSAKANTSIELISSSKNWKMKKL